MPRLQEGLRIVVSVWLTIVISTAAMSADAGKPQPEEVIPHHQDRMPGPALSPEEAIGKMRVPDGFRVELVAAEPDLVNPVAMTFDERGRIWVVESLEYPRLEAGTGKDRVKILEDTDGDGQADRFTIFSEGLNIPSGIAVGHGGVWVANSPDLLFLRDTDGDDQADTREVIVTGFGRKDTHELPNSLVWGPDGWLYGLNGVFNPSVVKQGDREFNFTCAVWRLHPRTREFQLFAEGTSNPWGIGFDPEGSLFVSACVIDHLWHLAETGYYHRQGGPYPPFTWKIGSIVAHTHQKAAYCGLTYFDSDAYPAEYRDRLYMGNIHGGCVNVDVLERRGSTYFATPAPDFLTADDAWFMPVSQKTGPDGSLYVLDWYDRYHCYQDARRDPEGIDRLKGRLYRVRYGETPRVWGFDLAKESDAQLVERLHSPNIYYRDIAQRLLAERATPATRDALQDLVFDESAPIKTRMHAFWSLAGSGPLDPGFHGRLLKHDNSTLRAWGVRVAGNMGQVDPKLRDTVVSLTADASPDVLLQVAVAAGKVEGVDPVETLINVLARSGDDPLIPHIVWQNLHPLLGEQTERVLAVLGGSEAAAAEPVLRLLPRVVDRILALENSDIGLVVALFERLADDQADGEAAAAEVLRTLANRIQSREVKGDRLVRLKGKLDAPLAKHVDGESQGQLALESLLLAATWGDAGAQSETLAILASDERPVRQRLRALDVLTFTDDVRVLDVVAPILSDPASQEAELIRGTLTTLGRLESAETATKVLAGFTQLLPEHQELAVELVTQRAEWGRQLLERVGQGKVPADAMNANHARKLLSFKNDDVTRLVRQHWGTVRDQRDPAREQVIAEMRELLQKTPADPRRGHLVFRKLCGQCHRIYGEGQTVGPDLTNNGRGSFDQLLSNVFDPSLVIGRAYQSTLVITADGRVLNGLAVEETPNRLVLKLQGGKQETIARSDIEERKRSRLSMMPEGIEKQLTPQEIADLFAFLMLEEPPKQAAAGGAE